MSSIVSTLKNYNVEGTRVKFGYHSSGGGYIEGTGTILRQIGSMPTKERLKKIGHPEGRVYRAMYKIDLDRPLKFQDYVNALSISGNRISAIFDTLNIQKCIFDDKVTCIIMPFDAVEILEPKKGTPVEFTLADQVNVASIRVFAGIISKIYKPTIVQYSKSKIVDIFLFDPVPAYSVDNIFDVDEAVKPHYVSTETRHIGKTTYEEWKKHSPETCPPSSHYDEHYKIYTLAAPIPLESVKNVCKEMVEAEVEAGLQNKSEANSAMADCLIMSAELQIMPIDLAHTGGGAIRPMRHETAYYYVTGIGVEQGALPPGGSVEITDPEAGEFEIEE